MPRELTPADVQDFRERLCAVAEDLFARDGPQQVTMRQIAKAMGVSAMTPYRYFADKDEILAAVRERGFLRFAEKLEAARPVDSGARQRAAAVRAAYLDFAFGNAGTYKLMFDLHQTDEVKYPTLVAAVLRARETMSAYVADLIAEGLLSGDPEELGKLFWSTVHGAVVLEMAKKLPPGSAQALAGRLNLLTPG